MLEVSRPFIDTYRLSYRSLIKDQVMYTPLSRTLAKYRVDLAQRVLEGDGHGFVEVLQYLSSIEPTLISSWATVNNQLN